jgi:hypothetical protein
MTVRIENNISQSIADDRYVNVTGDTMTGTLSIAGADERITGLSSGEYIDFNQIPNYIYVSTSLEIPAAKYLNSDLNYIQLADDGDTQDMTIYSNNNMSITCEYNLNLTGGNITLQDVAGEININTDQLDISAPLNMLTGDINLLDNLSTYYGTGNDLRIYHNGTNSLITNTTGKLMFTSPSTFDFIAGTADTDIVINFTGTTNSGVFKWMEDESRFDFDDLVFVSATTDSAQRHFGVETYSLVGNTGATKSLFNVTGYTTSGGAGSDSIYGLRFSIQNANSSGNQSGGLCGFNGQVTNYATGTGTCSSIYAGDILSQQRSANALTTLVGLRAAARIYNTSGTTGTVSQAYGITNEVYSYINSSTITSAYANRSLIYHTNTYTSTFGTSYCYYAEIQAQDGTMTTGYGLYVEAFTKDTGTFTNATSIW